MCPLKVKNFKQRRQKEEIEINQIIVAGLKVKKERKEKVAGFNRKNKYK